MGEIFTVDDIRRTSWREDLEERQAYESRRREIEEERERKARGSEHLQGLYETLRPRRPAP